MEREQQMIEDAMTFNGSDELLRDDRSKTNGNEEPNVSGITDVSSPILSKTNSVLRHTVDAMDVDGDGDVDRYRTPDPLPDNEGNDDSTLYGNDDQSTQENEHHEPKWTHLNGKKKMVKRSVYEVYDDGRKAPFQLSRDRVRNRSVMIYDAEHWDRGRLEGFKELIGVLGMKTVYTVEDAKFIVLDGEKRESTVRDRILLTLGKQYYNGCHHVREVYYRDIFYLLQDRDARMGVVFGQDSKERDKNFVISSLDINAQYLHRNGLWPLRGSTDAHQCNHKT